MIDQAQGLRKLVEAENSSSAKNTRIITVTSGKGGVGKSNFSLNFALSLQSQGYNVLIFDADIGLANIDVLMGISPKYNLYHLLEGEKTIWEIIEKGQNGIQFISGGSGFNSLVRLSEEELNYFIEQIGLLNGYFDFIIFDTGAGLSNETLKFIVSTQELIIVTTPEPTSITDAYAIIKMVHSVEQDIQFRLVVNRSSSTKEGSQTADKISLVAKKFLHIDIATLGCVADDNAVSKAVKRQIPFLIAYPYCHASKGIHQLAQRFLTEQDGVDYAKGGVHKFIHKLIRFNK